MKYRSWIIVLVVLAGACKQKPGSVSSATQETAVFSGAEEVTAAVGALLPAPHSFQLKQAKKWHDASGENWLVLYETGSYIQKPKTAASAQLSAILYQKTDSGFVETWKMTDEVTDCESDVACSFYDNQLSVTDLDSNGLAEVTLVYSLGCKGDVQANNKVLVLYEGNRKYTLLGTETVLLSNDTIPGIITNDTPFRSAPVVLRNFANQYWSRFGIQKYE